MTIYQFPKDLSLDLQPYMIFKAFEWKTRGKQTQNIETIEDTRNSDTIILPISTNGIIDSINNSWENAIGLTASSFKDVIIRNIGAKGLDLLGDLGKYFSARRGFLVNDHSSLAFTGTEFRQFEFNFTLIPKNSVESNVILEIVKSFKRNSLPEYREWKIIYPNYWNIIIMFPGSKEIIKFKKCILSSFNNSYFGDGIPSILKDGTPLKTDISLSFNELEKIDRKDYT